MGRVRVSTHGGSARIGDSRALFQLPHFTDSGLPILDFRPFAVSPAGQSFAAVESIRDAGGERIVRMQNWQADLQERKSGLCWARHVAPLRLVCHRTTSLGKKGEWVLLEDRATWCLRLGR